MSDLTDEELEMASTMHDRLSEVNARAWVDPAAMLAAERLQRAALELQRHRAAHDADEERVRSVVREAVLAEGREHPGRDTWYPAEYADAIATRAAKQLASAAVRLSDEDVRHLRWLSDRSTMLDGSTEARIALERLLATVRP